MTIRFCIALLLGLLLLMPPAFAFEEVDAADSVSPEDLPQMVDVPEGAVSWELLGRTFAVEAPSGKEEDRLTGYHEDILALDGKRARFFGYIIITDLERLSYSQAGSAKTSHERGIVAPFPERLMKGDQDVQQRADGQ